MSEFRENVLRIIGDNEDAMLSKIEHQLVNCIDSLRVKAVYYSNFFAN